MPARSSGDGVWPSATQPAISTGLRGALQAMLRLETARQQAHSGLVGGVARNPVRELCALATAIDGALIQSLHEVDAVEAEVLDLVRELRRETGAAILLISEELEELISLSDRIYVLYEGEIMGEVLDGDIDAIGQMMTGTRQADLTAREES